MADNPYRNLPSVGEVLTTATLRALEGLYPAPLMAETVRSEIAELRKRLGKGMTVDGELVAESIAQRAAARLGVELQPRLRPVINATGIVLHTNLGRAPIAPEAAEAARQAAAGYLNLELDLETGKRSSRQVAVRNWLCRLTGAESATVVNNNAAATVIVLRAIAMGREVVISRGQLIEIGGSFRIPEIMAVSGAILREVGTTNITRLSDFERAIGQNTGALLQVHSSNYRVSGFTQSVALPDLVSLGRKQGIPVIDDIGSGALVDFTQFGFQGEPVASKSVAAGADLVLFSGDKLLGGPQAGIIIGKKEWIQKIEKDPLMRAFRLDKMTLAALETTLRLYLNSTKVLQSIPVLRLLSLPLADLQQQAQTLAARLARLPGITEAVAERTDAYVGGGSLPDQAMPTWVVKLRASHITEEQLSYRLRTGRWAVLARAQEGRLILDLRTIFPEQVEPLIALLGEAMQA
ncbi:MAG: L-seryl-tRNA(Sec) selenium transferase [Gemmataceae bacterium]